MASFPSSCQIAGQYGNLVRGRPRFKGGGWVVRVLDRDEVRRLVSMADEIAAVREALAAADPGGAGMPAPFGMRLAGARGAGHVDGAYLVAREDGARP